MTIPRTMANAGASYISMDLGLPGPAWTVSTACSSSNHAIGQAFHMVRACDADLALAGGSEATFSFGILKAWEAMRVVSADTCRPFSKDRSGMILGEGGAMLVLEPLENALARGAKIYCEIVGAGMSADAHHITQPSVEGPVRAMRMALRDAATAPDAVDYINAHRHRHGSGRRDGNRGDSRSLLSPRRETGGEFHQIDARPHAGSRRSHRSRRHRASHPRPLHPADRELPSPRSPLPVTWT